MFQFFSFLKYNVKSLPGQCQKHFNIKNIKVKPPVAPVKENIMKYVLFLKVKSQAKAY